MDAVDDLTVLLAGARNGDRVSIDRLVARLYPDLRQLAHSRLWQSGQITLLETTALVHESYLRLLKAGQVGVLDRSNFMAYAARAMRSIIIDFIRQRQADRRGGGQAHLPLDTGIANMADASEDQILRINEALETLAKVDERLVRVVELRYFAGFTEQEIAECLGLTDRTVRRDWEKARVLLAAALR